MVGFRRGKGFERVRVYEGRKMIEPSFILLSVEQTSIYRARGTVNDSSKACDLQYMKRESIDSVLQCLPFPLHQNDTSIPPISIISPLKEKTLEQYYVMRRTYHTI